MPNNVPQIDIGKVGRARLHVTQGLPLPSNSPFGNLAAKFMDIISRLDHVNERIAQLFQSYETTKANPLGPGSITDHLLILEEVVYWMRKTADELITLIDVLERRVTTGTYPLDAGAFPIKELLGKKELPVWAAPHVDLLRFLNETSNALKHSFVNSSTWMVGRDEPGLYALALKWNDLSKYPTQLFNATARVLVQRYSQFFQAAREELRKCPLPHQENPPRQSGC